MTQNPLISLDTLIQGPIFTKVELHIDYSVQEKIGTEMYYIVGVWKQSHTDFFLQQLKLVFFGKGVSKPLILINTRSQVFKFYPIDVLHS